MSEESRPDRSLSVPATGFALAAAVSSCAEGSLTKESNGMPSYPGRLDARQRAAVTAFIYRAIHLRHR